MDSVWEACFCAFFSSLHECVSQMLCVKLGFRDNFIRRTYIRSLPVCVEGADILS